MSILFDTQQVQERLRWSATKWEKYRDCDIIPMWIADMDFLAPPAVRAALAEHVAHGTFGYMQAPIDLAAELAADYQERYRWAVQPEWIVWLPGLVAGLHLAIKACTLAGEGVLSLAPVYPPFLQAAKIQERTSVNVPLQLQKGAERPEYVLDFAALTRALEERRTTNPVRLLLLCHPHNPIGRLFSNEELAALEDFCAAHDLFVCSDEVHSDLVLDPNKQHMPFAPFMEQRSGRLARSITLHGPGKTFNLAGLGVAWAIIPDAGVRGRFRAAMQKLVPEQVGLGYSGLRATLLGRSEDWRQILLQQLRENRAVASAALTRMGLAHTYPEVSYLIWIDARALADRVGNPVAWFERQGVGLSEGADFGAPGFVRLNFALPPALLEQALTRMETAIQRLYA